MIRVKGLHKTYHAQRSVLKGVNFNLDFNKTYALMGHSGSGKSTLLKILAGHEVADKGVIQIDTIEIDLTVSGLIKGRRGVAFVSQEDKLLPKHTVWEQLDYSSRSLHNIERNKRIKEISKAFNIKHLKNRKVENLSGGERQRVNIGAQLLIKEPILILDEPFTFLDTASRMAVFSLVKSYALQDHTTIIFATHLADEVYALADEILVMKSGRILRKTDPKRMYCFPKSEYEGNLLGHCYSLKLKTTPYEFIVRPEWWKENAQDGHMENLWIKSQKWCPQGYLTHGINEEGKEIQFFTSVKVLPNTWVRRYLNLPKMSKED